MQLALGGVNSIPFFVHLSDSPLGYRYLGNARGPGRIGQSCGEIVVGCEGMVRQ